VSSPESRAAWARLMTKVYEADPLVCGRFGSPMRVVAVITEPQQVRKILRHLIKTGKAPPGLDPASVRSARTDYGRAGRAFRAIMRTIVNISPPDWRCHYIIHGQTRLYKNYT
jgi:hypothetical protein